MFKFRTKISGTKNLSCIKTRKPFNIFQNQVLKKNNKKVRKLTAGSSLFCMYIGQKSCIPKNEKLTQIFVQISTKNLLYKNLSFIKTRKPFNIFQHHDLKKNNKKIRKLTAGSPNKKIRKLTAGSSLFCMYITQKPCIPKK